jgi:hypothetical protein
MDPRAPDPRTLAGSLAGLLFLALSSSALSCDSPRTQSEATSDEIRAFVRARKARVLTFTGYSGAEYEDAAAMLAHAERVLSGFDPKRTVVNIGATAAGIGAAYEVAKRRGFVTMGIVSTVARDEAVPLSPCVDHVFFVRDSTWGGLLPGSTQLSPTSAAMVAVSNVFVGIGGGDVARDEMLAARRAGKKVTFIPADMNREIARKKAQKKGEPEPTDFRGSAHAALAGGG